MKKLVIGLMCVFLIATLGCSAKSGFRFFATQGDAVDAAMKTAAQFYDAGKISDSEKARIVEAYNVWKASYDDAIDEYVAYQRLPDEMKDTALDKIIQAVEIMNRNLDQLGSILELFGIELD